MILVYPCRCSLLKNERWLATAEDSGSPIYAGDARRGIPGRWIRSQLHLIGGYCGNLSKPVCWKRRDFCHRRKTEYQLDIPYASNKHKEIIDPLRSM
jgi:hypothetical protein